MKSLDGIIARAGRLAHLPEFQISILGILSGIFYFHLTSTYPLDAMVAKHSLTDFGRVNGYIPSAMYDYLLSLAIPFVAYLLAWKILTRHAFRRRLLVIVLLFAFFFAASLAIMYPIGATDIFDYVFYSRILVHYGQNPLTVPPITFRGDPFLKTVVWYKTPSPYGPLWLLLTVPGSLLAGEDLTLNLLAMHALPAIFFLASAALIAFILKKSDPKHLLVGTLLYAWNPLVLFEGPGNGHNGIIMMFFVLLAIYFLVRRKWTWVLPALMASVLVKYISAILILPFLIYCWRSQPSRREQLLYFVRTSAISLVIFSLIELPFFAIPSGLFDEASWYSLLAVPTLAVHFLDRIISESDAKNWVLATTTIGYLILYFVSLKYIPTLQQPRRLVLLSTWLTAAYLIIACVYFQPWFIKWLVALGIWANHRSVRRVILAFTASGLASYVVSFYWVWNWTTWDKLYTNAVFVAVIFGPPILMGLFCIAQFNLPALISKLQTRSPMLQPAAEN